MIVVRNVFRLKFGKAREMRELWQEWTNTNPYMGELRGYRTMVDVTGESYTFVLETDFDSLASFEAGQAALFGTPEWRAFYSKVTPLVESGYREIFQLIDVGTAETMMKAAAGMATA
jgi:hypothetical protein